MSETIEHLLWMVLLTFLPTLELRASIPFGIIVMDDEIPWLAVTAICIAANIALAPLVWLFVHHVMGFFLKVEFIKKIYDWLVVRTQRRVEPYVERWGTLGLALFIGVPLPGSGVYSGCLGAYLLGFRFRDYMLASALGVLIAGSVVTAVMILAPEAFHFMYKAPEGSAAVGG